MVSHLSREVLAAGLESAAAALVIDLSDAPSEAALVLVGDMLTTHAGAETGPRLYVRIPPLDQPACARILDRAVAAGAAGILLPMAMSGQDVTLLDAKISVAEAVHGRADGMVRIIAEATANARAIAGLDSYRGASHRLVGLIWHADGLVADLALNGPRDANGHWRPALQHARARLLLAAAAADAMAIDWAPEPDEHEASVLATGVESADDGFGAMLVTRPDAVALVTPVRAMAADKRPL